MVYSMHVASTVLFEIFSKNKFQGTFTVLCKKIFSSL